MNSEQPKGNIIDMNKQDDEKYLEVLRKKAELEGREPFDPYKLMELCPSNDTTDDPEELLRRAKAEEWSYLKSDARTIKEYVENYQKEYETNKDSTGHDD